MQRLGSPTVCNNYGDIIWTDEHGNKIQGLERDYCEWIERINHGKSKETIRKETSNADEKGKVLTAL